MPTKEIPRQEDIPTESYHATIVITTRELLSRHESYQATRAVITARELSRHESYHATRAIAKGVITAEVYHHASYNNHKSFITPQ